MKKAKLAALITAGVMLTSMLAACGGGSSAGSSAASSASAGSSATSEATAEAASSGSEAASSAASESAGGGSYKIGLSLEGLDHSFMTTLRDQVLAAAEAYEGADVEVLVTDGENDVVTQANGIEDMISQGIDLLMIECSVYEGLEGATGACEEAGIPYIFVGKPAWGTKATTVVSCDNKTIAGEIGQWTIDYLKEKNGEAKGNIVEITGIAGDTSAKDRQEGFEEAIAGESGIKIVSTVDGNYRRDASYDAMQDALQANPEGTIDVVYAASGETSIGAFLAAQDAGRAGEFAIVSIDGDKDTVSYVKDGNITASWTYETCGTAGFETAMKILNGEQVEEYTIVPSVRIDAENCETATVAF